MSDKPPLHITTPLATVQTDQPVQIVTPAPAPAVAITDTQAVISPKTTAEEDRQTASKRSINKHWEFTQSGIALSFMLCAEIVILFSIVYITELRMTAFNFLCTIVGTVIGFYFGRTNHERQGGTGPSVSSGSR